VHTISINNTKAGSNFQSVANPV